MDITDKLSIDNLITEVVNKYGKITLKDYSVCGIAMNTGWCTTTGQASGVLSSHCSLTKKGLTL